MFLSTIGQRLRARRRGRGLTQAELAAAAGVSPRFLVQLEGGTGNISVQRLRDVCAVLDFPLARLFDGLGPGSTRCIALVGLRGAGKSSVGRALADRLGATLVELDEQVEASAGMSLASVFELWGEARYRELESQALAHVLARREPVVLATGGSLVTATQTWQRLRSAAWTIWLRATPSAHLARVRAQGDLRPMSGRADPLAELRDILRVRSPLYAQADLCLDTDELGIDGVVAHVLVAVS
ncbi:MAG: helix-turn-helix domain-containing protein [Oligoflexia bacterium]|nr:helix-turn-helix domain-containing protein [Oligoflexia bacterium]